MKIEITEINALAKKILQGFGYTPGETEIILEVLMYAQLRGNNQGLIKLIGKGYPRHTSAKTSEITKETKLSAQINGNLTPAILVLKNATDIAVAKAKEHGFGLVGTNNTNASTGAIGYYANQIAREGLIGFVFAGSSLKLVATYGSYEPILGTNPIAIAIPSVHEPIVLDMATAAMALYGVLEAKTAGTSLPVDTAYDKDGNLTIDPSEALEGAILTFDRGNKSAGLSMIVQALTGPLVGAAFTGIGERDNWGNLVFAIDPELLIDRNEFKKNVSLMIKKIKATKKLPGIADIYVPGERGNGVARRTLKSGKLEIEANLYKQLKEAAQKT